MRRHGIADDRPSHTLLQIGYLTGIAVEQLLHGWRHLVIVELTLVAVAQDGHRTVVTRHDDKALARTFIKYIVLTCPRRCTANNSWCHLPAASNRSQLPNVAALLHKQLRLFQSLFTGYGVRVCVQYRQQTHYNDVADTFHKVQFLVISCKDIHFFPNNPPFSQLFLTVSNVVGIIFLFIFTLLMIKALLHDV